MNVPIEYLCLLVSFSSVLGGKQNSNHFNQAANGILDGLGKLEGLLDAFGSASANCVYKCPNGAKPMKNKGHKPTYNGCGSMGIELDTEGLPAMTKCCNKHDLCYDTCGADRNQCDEDFKNCLYKMCEKEFNGGKSSTFSKKKLDGCKSTGDLMYIGTMGLGCKSFLDAQEKACTCHTSRKDEF
ncbi:group XIIA secretory phospholipase A2-like [Glandiceps talaboti]